MIACVTKEGTIETQDGRQLAYVERGTEDGTPVFLLHGTPGSRMGRYPDASEYERRNLRVVTYDRPGYGKSDPDPGRTVGSAPPDIRAIADELGFERFATFGVSGGAPHSLACAALLGDRVTRAAAMVTPAPYDAPGLDFMEGMTDLNVKEFSAALEGEEALAQLLQPFVDATQADPDEMVSALAAELPPVDQAVLERPEVREMLRDAMSEAVRQGSRGWIDDDLAFTKPWGFGLEQIEKEVGLWQGELDVLAPRSHGEYVASKLPNATFQLIPEAGHMDYDQWPAVFDWLVAG
jgi:pimeloyl-ACP methyl ester carboxylesterase